MPKANGIEATLPGLLKQIQGGEGRPLVYWLTGIRIL